MPKGKRPAPPPLRPLPPGTVAWAETGLSADSPYRRIGDTFYPTMYRAYIAEVIRLPTAPTLTPIDMMFLVALGGQLDLSSDATATRFRADPAWHYALHLPLDHPGCSDDDLWRFIKRTENPRIARIPFGMIIEMVRLAFLPPLQP
jgi:hypothetical protein